MNAGGKSLRSLVEKWFAPNPASPVRIAHFGRTHRHQRRYVCVETSWHAGVFAIFFFRHDDGSWCVFPPEDQSSQTGQTT